MLYTKQKYRNSPYFLTWKFFGNVQPPQGFGQITPITINYSLKSKVELLNKMFSIFFCLKNLFGISLGNSIL